MDSKNKLIAFLATFMIIMVIIFRKNVFIIFSAALFSIIVYWISLANGKIPITDREKYKLALEDKLNRIIFEVGIIPVTGWSLTHVWLYTVLGFLFPKQFWPLMIAGVLWELFEWFMGRVNEPKLKFEHFVKELQKKFPDRDFEFASKIYKSFWGGNQYDIIMNFVGFCIGYYLRSASKWKGMKKVKRTKM